MPQPVFDGHHPEAAGELVGMTDIEAAARRLADVLVATPLLPPPMPGNPVGSGPAAGDADPGQLWIKPENLQRVGSFKIRGAYNALAALSPECRERGVVAYSSGNHGQAVAEAARQFGVSAAVVVPDQTPRNKIEAISRRGAEVVTVPLPERESRAMELVEQRAATLIPPFDHRDVIAGQGTVGLEIARQTAAARLVPSSVLVPISGGGLLSGTGVALRELLPGTRIVGVEPELAADTAASLRAGELTDWPLQRRASTVADGLRAVPSPLTFRHLQFVVDEVVTVSEQEILDAVGVLARQRRLVAEPSGAVTTAAWLRHRHALPDGPAVAVLSGGNVDPALLSRVLAS